MKKVLTLIMLFVAAISANAAKSSGKPCTFQQPDGTTVTVRLLGDEHFCWYQTIDGTLLERVGNAFYIAQVNADGTLSATKALAHNLEARTAEETALAKAQDFSLFAKTAETTASQRRKVIAGYPSGSAAAPHMGEYHIPIILMNYTDSVFSIAKTDAELKAVFEEFFNGTTRTPWSSATRFEGYSSASMFFQDASYGQFKPVFDIYGPYTADHEHHYYGRVQGLERELSLLKEAVKKADADIDFSKYDSNNDGNADIVYILFAGASANLSQDTNDFWAACWSTSGYFANADGKKINVIGGTSELATYPAKANGLLLRSGIGVFCHEMSHGLGLPDLYNTTVGNKYGPEYNNGGPEDWDLMDNGENIYNGMWPCQYNAWEKDIMGWLTVEELSEPANITIYPLNKEGGKAYRVTNPANTNEYYIIENYPGDEWNYRINKNTVKSDNSVGLMITHINASSSGFSMTPNNTLNKPNISIIPADGLLLSSYNRNHTILYNGVNTEITNDIYNNDLAGDPYPGSQNVTALAAYNNYTGEDMVSKYPITDITKNSDGSITFNFMGGTTTAINTVTPICEQADASRVYTIDGRYAGTSLQSLPSGLYIINGHKIVK